jgi:hypothetical protein
MLKLACVGREFTIWAGGRSSPIVDWLRALARQAHAECGGKGVGAVGMCFTGGFALAMMTEPSVVAPVLAEPSLPAGGKHGAATGLLAGRAGDVKARMEAEDLSLMALRFEGDKHRRPARASRPWSASWATGSSCTPCPTPRPARARAAAAFGADPAPEPRRPGRRDDEGPSPGAGLLQGTDRGLRQPPHWTFAPHAPRHPAFHFSPRYRRSIRRPGIEATAP